MKKIDIHVHAIRGEGINFYQTDKTIATPDEVIAIYKKQDIEKGLIMPLINVEFGNRIQGNEDAMDIVRQYPDSFDWFCNLDPRMGSTAPGRTFPITLNIIKKEELRASARLRPISFLTTRI